ncbi:MAG: non-homologous end-joining DNA ligase [Armatimonadia bacterium]
MSKTLETQLAGHTLRLSNLDKVLYPSVGFTKAEVIDYYVRIADTVMPHVRNRPMTMARYPDGVEGEMFYQKRCPDHKPDYVRKVYVWSETYKRKVTFCVIDDLASLIYLINLAAIELHPLLATADDVNTPTLMTFDLDPGPGADLVDCSRVALQLRDLLRQAGLDCFPKTSGKKGMHLNVPLNTPCTYDETKGFARAIAMLLEKYHPEQVTSNMRKDLRRSKVFVDWSQNDEHKSTVCVYSLRVWERPTVSTPLKWEEVQDAVDRKDGSGLSFETEQTLERVQQYGDLYALVATLQQNMPVLTGVS